MAEWEAHKTAGNAAYSKGNFGEALSEYTVALGSAAIGPEDRAVILCNRAQVHLRTKAYAAAVEDCTACLTLAPNNVKAMFRRGTALEALGNKSDAIKDFREVVRLDPAVADAHAALKRLDPTSDSRRSAGGKAAPLKITKDEMNALVEADARATSTERQLTVTKERLATADRERKVMETTVRVMSELPEDTRVFDAIGKMFLLKPRDVLQAQLAERIESATQTVAVCSKTLDYLQKQKAENAANLSELTKAIEARA